MCLCPSGFMSNCKREQEANLKYEISSYKPIYQEFIAISVWFFFLQINRVKERRTDIKATLKGPSWAYLKQVHEMWSPCEQGGAAFLCFVLTGARDFWRRHSGAPLSLVGRLRLQTTILATHCTANISHPGEGGKEGGRER